MAKKKTERVALTRVDKAERYIMEKLSPVERARVWARGMAQLGAQKGGRARAKKLSPEERSRIARRGGKARWGLNPDEPATSRRRRRPASAA